MCQSKDRFYMSEDYRETWLFVFKANHKKSDKSVLMKTQIVSPQCLEIVCIHKTTIIKLFQRTFGLQINGKNYKMCVQKQNFKCAP